MYQRILVPIDGSATSDRGLEEAIKLGKLTGAKLRLLHVVDDLSLASAGGMAYTGDMLGILRAEGGEIVSKAQAQVQARGLEVDTVLNDSLAGRVSDIVLAQVGSWGADLIVLGTHGRRGVRRLFMGSDAENIIRASTVPVLLLRADPVAAAADAF
ncbi:MAG: universal stress protein [Burkholderiaceae bacterium]